MHTHSRPTTSKVRELLRWLHGVLAQHGGPVQAALFLRNQANAGHLSALERSLGLWYVFTEILHGRRSIHASSSGQPPG